MTRFQLFDCKTEMIDPVLQNSGILIVDCKVANIELLEGFLVMQGYTKIKTTNDYRKVIPLFQTFAPDLILLNLSMPYLSGFRVLHLLKAFVQSNVFVPILVFADEITKSAKLKALSEGASDFLSKPFDLVEVDLRIRNLLLTKYLLQQLENQKQTVEEKVKERILDIEQSNIELVAARDKAEASNRFITTFMKAITIEILTPFNIIPGFDPMAFEPSFSDTEIKEYSDILNFNQKCLMQTITDCIDMSLIISGKLEVMISRFAPGIVIDEIKKQFQSQCNRKGILLQIQKHQYFNSVIISSDKSIISKILTQLLDNALKYTKEGTITLGVSITINVIEFFVKDTGIGINEDDLSIILGQFSSEDAASVGKRESSCLGLTIVSGMVSLLGGKIRVESVVGRGSTFAFTVPWVEERINDNYREIASESDSDMRRPIILIAEDEPYSFLFFELVLDGEYEIIRAEDGEEAVEFCKLIPGIELVLMDIKLPKMNGLIATQEIKKLRKSLPVIAVTGCAEDEIRQECLNAGCDEYLNKPISKKDLLKKMREFIVADYHPEK